MEEEFNLEELLEDEETIEIQTQEEEETDYAENLLDVQIIVKNLKSIELLVKALTNMKLKENYNINISSIIPSNNIEFIKKSVTDADLILITTELTSSGKEEFINYYKELKTDYNYVEYLIFSNNGGAEFTESSQIEDEIQKSIIRASLTSILSNVDKNQVKKDYTILKDKNEQLNLENEGLINQSRKIQDENIKLKEEIHKLNREIDTIKSEYADFKTRYSNIHTKDLLEYFNIKQLWEETFNETFTQYDKVLLATNHFNPENIILGQNYIAAKTKDKAIDWLRIIKTSLIFLSDNAELKEEINEIKQETQNEDTNTFTNLWE